MGSPSRLVAALAAGLAASVVAVAPARADAGADARAAAAAFLDALANRDAARVCGLLTPEALARFGGERRCAEDVSGGTRPEGAAVETLSRALSAARRSAKARGGRFVTARFGVAKLARAMERLAPNLTVKVGRGPRAAAGQPVTTAILDARTSARRLIVYAEADDGTIWRLATSPNGDPELANVGTGVPETTPAPAAPEFTFTVDAVTPLEDGAFLARASLRVSEGSETETYRVLLFLVPRGGAYLVDDLYISTLASP